jgi:hypothetical protein
MQRIPPSHLSPPPTLMRDQRYKINYIERPDVQIYGTFECGLAWQNMEEFEHVWSFVNDIFVDICYTDYEKERNNDDLMNDDLNEYLAERLDELLNYYNAYDRHFLFSNIECSDREFFQECLYRYNYNTRYDNNLFTVLCFSSEECIFEKIAEPRFKNALDCD